MLKFREKREQMKKDLDEKKRKRRIQSNKQAAEKVISELDDVWKKCIFYPDPEDWSLLHFKFIMESGIWKDHQHTVELKFPESYPWKPPRCRFLTKIWHPHIDTEGHINLNVLRKEYHPKLTTLNIIFYSIRYLLDDPDPSDPLNFEASRQFVEDYAGFLKTAKRWMSLYAKKYMRSLSSKELLRGKKDEGERISFLCGEKEIVFSNCKIVPVTGLKLKNMEIECLYNLFLV